MERFPEDIQDFANQFVELQESRHLADYDPFSRFARHDVVTAIEAADVAIRKLQNSDIQSKRAFAAWSALKSRQNRESHQEKHPNSIQ